MPDRTVRDLHDEAMRYAQDAIVAQHLGDTASAQALATQALPLEIEAVSQLANEPRSEPTRSILYLSAASIAMRAGEMERARELATEGLAGSPSPRTAAELRCVLNST